MAGLEDRMEKELQHFLTFASLVPAGVILLHRQCYRRGIVLYLR